MCFFLVLGDPRTNQNPAFLALGIVFYRWHNLQAAKLQQANPEWDDEDIFQAARRRVIATLQVIIQISLPLFIPDFSILEKSNKYKRDNESRDPTFSTLLQNIIMYEYLPSLLGQDLAPYTGYKPDVHPGISHVFQSAAFR